MHVTTEIEFYLDKIQFSASPASKLKDKDLEEKEEIIKKHIKKHPGCCELLQNVFESGPITVEFCDPSEIHAPESWSILSRKLRMSTAEKNSGSLLESFILRLCHAKTSEIEPVITNLSQLSTLRDYLELYPTAEAFADKKTLLHSAAHGLATQIYQFGLECYKWPTPKGTMRSKQIFEENFSTLESSTKEIDDLVRSENFKKQYIDGALFVIEANKKRNGFQIQQDLKTLVLGTEILIEMKKTIQTNHEISGIKKDEIVYTESERMLEAYEFKLNALRNLVAESNKEREYLEEKEKEFKKALEVIRVKMTKALPQIMHIATKIEIMTRIKNWLLNYNKIEQVLTGQLRVKFTETFVKIQNFALNLEKLDAPKVHSELTTYEEEIASLIEKNNPHKKQNFFQRVSTLLSSEKTESLGPQVFQKK